MSTAELNRTKLDLIAWINRLSDERVIEFLEGFKKSRVKADWWEELSDNQREIIRNGLRDIEIENTLTSSQFWTRLKNG